MIKSQFKSFCKIFVVLIVSLLISSTVFALSENNVEKNDKKVRVMTINDSEDKKALENGCRLIRDVKKAKVKAFECPSEVAKSLNLSEDIKFRALDIDADNQIRASEVWNINVCGTSTTTSLKYSSSNYCHVSYTGKGSKIVVLDTGYNYYHPDLRSSYLGGYDFVNDDNDPMDDDGHGSFVAGLITADGIANPRDKGVAPDTGIIAGKVMNNNGAGYFTDVLEAIYWAVDNYHPDAISLSMGTYNPVVFKDYCDDLYPQFTEAVKYAIENNVSFIASAGNDGEAGSSFPACISHSFSVGAVDSKDRIAYFSGRGKGVDIYAPGVYLYSTSRGTSYSTMSGTSASAPIVGGVVALMKQKEPTLNATSVQKRIMQNSRPLRTVNSIIYRVDAWKALGIEIMAPRTPLMIA